MPAVLNIVRIDIFGKMPALIRTGEAACRRDLYDVQKWKFDERAPQREQTMLRLGRRVADGLRDVNTRRNK
jgi:hypothetical protein